MSQFPEEPLDIPSSEGYGYFPAYPGQKLDGRYKIIRKLGYGSRSSVWLATKPKEQDIYYAIKILTVHESLQDSVRELDSLLFQENKCTTLYESFTITSLHGEHLCLVLDVVGPSLQDLQNISPNNLLGISVIQRATACILETLDKLHDLGLIHGAITPTNVAFRVSPFIEALEGDLRRLPDSRIEQMITLNGVDYPVVRSHHLPPWVEWDSCRSHVNRQNLLLNNYGHAQQSEGMATWEKSGMDKSLRPPECIIGSPYSYTAGADIWMLGCAVYEILTGQPLVPSEKAKDDKSMLAWIIAMSGETPEAIKTIKSEHKYFDDEGKPLFDVPEESLESRISATTTMNADEISGVVKFVQRCLALDPDYRPSAKELMADEWILPGFYG